jgi:glycosyltransferase involved in cell wall biosynthesis
MSVLYYWLSNDPLIVRYSTVCQPDFGDLLPDVRLYRLPFYHWHFSADEVEAYHLAELARHPQHVLHHLINERNVCLELQARGIPAIFCNHNAFLDERVFTVRSRPVRPFDAVYNARMNPFKRHTLAREISKLLVIGGVFAEGDSYEYFAGIRDAMPQARFTHATDDRYYSEAEVAATVAQARVGLCLSSVEGAMYAAVEYLLCGLPVVSTASRGGRDEWFDGEYVRIVPDDPQAVRDAVEELIALDLSPYRIRQQTLHRMCEHRQRLFELGQSIYDHELAGRDFTREFYERFFNKMYHWRDPATVMENFVSDSVAGACLPCPTR